MRAVIVRLGKCVLSQLTKGVVEMKHVLESQQFEVKWLEGTFFPEADRMARIVDRGGAHEALRNKRMISFFYEPSTRTRASFEIAMDRLGGRVVFSTENAKEFSSAFKGESLAHTIKVLDRYRADVIVLRYHELGGAELAASLSHASIINAGDGPGQHPTQALLDVYTMRRRLGQPDGLNVVIVGDLKHGRTARSLAYLLCKYKGVRVTFVSPDDLRIDTKFREHLISHGLSFSEVDDIHDVVRRADVVYQTRTQRERGGVIDPACVSKFRIDRSVLDLMRKDAIIMHPLPINREEPALAEIDPCVDDDPRAVYLAEQIDAGLFTRMALLKHLLCDSTS